MAGGRPKGSLNKNKNALLTMLQKRYPGYDPIMNLAAVAMDDVGCKRCSGTGLKGTEPCEFCVDGKVVTTLNDRVLADKEVASYVKPKLKSIEVVADVSSTVTNNIKVSFVTPDEPSTDSK